MRMLLICLALAACIQDPDPSAMTERLAVRTDAEIAFVTQVLNDLQPKSIAQHREYCGLIGIAPDGTFVATRPRRGRMASCLPPDPRWVPMRVIASYHTHGAADPDYYSEIPSFDDMRTDIADNTDGYVATPGGRLWYVDTRARVANQLCGLGCLVSDPNHVEDPNLVVQPSYDLLQLLAL